MRLNFDTIGVAPGDRAGLWREVGCAVYVPMDAEPLVRNAFHARMEARTFLGRTWSSVDAGPQRVGRNERQIAAANARDIFTFVAQAEGTCAVEQAGKRAWLIPGDMLVFDNSRPYRLVFEQPFRQTVIQAPRDALGHRARGIERCLGERFAPANGCGRLLSGYVTGLSEALDELDEAEASVLIDELFALLAVRGETSAAPFGGDRARRALVWRAKRAARELIADPGLSAQRIARLQRVSLRTLQRAFEAEGASLMRWLRDERLERSAALLVDAGHRGHSIAEIAQVSGFATSPPSAAASSGGSGSRRAHGAQPGPQPVGDEARICPAENRRGHLRTCLRQGSVAAACRS